MRALMAGLEKFSMTSKLVAGFSVGVLLVTGFGLYSIHSLRQVKDQMTVLYEDQLLGVSHLKEIAALFMKERSATEPMALIQEATLPQQKIVTGTTADIVQLVQEHGISSPAVIVICLVCGLKPIARTTMFTV